MCWMVLAIWLGVNALLIVLACFRSDPPTFTESPVPRHVEQVEVDEKRVAMRVHREAEVVAARFWRAYEYEGE